MRREIERDWQYQRNAYTCERCKRVMITVDRDAGTTPFLARCRHCGGEAQSSMYRLLDQSIRPDHEWYRPSLEELRRIAAVDLGTLEHVLRGGLLLRPVEVHAVDLPDGGPLDFPRLSADPEVPEVWPIVVPGPGRGDPS